MKKKLIAMLTVLAILICQTACGSSTESTKSKSTTDTIKTIANETTADVSEAKPVSAEVSDNLADFSFLLDGVVYQLPFAYTELTANGWALADTTISETNALGGNDEMELWMTKENNKIVIEVYNRSGSDLRIVDCMVSGVAAINSDLSDASVFSIANGINTASGKDEILAAFGTPNETEDDTTSTIMYYRICNRYGSMVAFSLNDKYPQKNAMGLYNSVANASNIADISTEVPAYLADYVAPTALGDDPYSGVIEIDGDLYCIPAPVSAFIDNGWSIISDYGPDAVMSWDSDYIELQRGDMYLYLGIRNCADYRTIPENCVVCSVGANRALGVNAAGVAGLSIGDTEATALALVTEEYRILKGSHSTSYYYADGKDFSLSFDVEAATKTVSEIQISNQKWPY